MTQRNDHPDRITQPAGNGKNPRLAEAIQAWMVVRLAEELKVSSAEIDTRAALLSYGIDSVVAFNLTGELADRLGRELPTTLFWDFPTLEELALHLAHETPEGEQTKSLLAELSDALSSIERLSEEENS
jgi:acyl carrier protein